MQSVTMKMLCRVLVLAMMSLSFQTAHAGIIGIERAASVSTGQADRALVLAALERADVRDQLQAQGVDPQDALARVAAMSDQEVRGLAGSIATAPAGADATFLALVTVGVVVWYLFYRK